MRLYIFCIYTFTYILATCSIVYELMIAQTISLLSGNTVGKYSLTIGIYLGSMGIGALLCNKIFGKKQGWSSLFSIEIILSAIGGLSVIIIYAAHMIFSYFSEYDNAPVVFYLPAFIIITSIGFFTGLELPLLIKIGNSFSEQKKITNRVLGVDYIGSLTGAVLFPLFLLPHFEIVTISFLTALLNLIAALVILFYFPEGIKKTIPKLTAATLFLMLIAGLVNVKDIHQYFLKKYYYYIESSENLSTLIKPMKNFPEVERFTSPYQKIDIVKSPPYEDPYTSLLIEAYTTRYKENPNYPRYYYLFLNGEYQFSTDFEDIYHEFFVHIPIILNNKVPQKVLVLGGGDGLLNRELLKYSKVKSITHVELDEKMIEVAKTHPVLSYINKGSLENPRVKIKIADAYQYIKNTDERFDAIYIDFPSPVDYDLSKLYSREFYHFIKRSLNENGFAVIDSPGSEMDLTSYYHDKPMEPDSDWKIYFNTLKAAGFDTIIPFASNLDFDNPEVYKIFADAISKNSTIDLAEIESEKEEYILDVQKGFIMIKKGDEEINTIYKDPEVELYVLNEKRFPLAFASIDVFLQEKIDKKKINSIMRPTFPSISFWDIRLPY